MERLQGLAEFTQQCSAMEYVMPYCILVTDIAEMRVVGDSHATQGQQATCACNAHSLHRTAVLTSRDLELEPAVER